MAADVDFGAVAELCEGFSGDDITNICRDAAMNGMRILIAGKTPDEIRCRMILVYSWHAYRSPEPCAHIITISCLQCAQLMPGHYLARQCHVRSAHLLSLLFTCQSALHRQVLFCLKACIRPADKLKSNIAVAVVAYNASA